MKVDLPKTSPLRNVPNEEIQRLQKEIEKLREKLREHLQYLYDNKADA